MMTNLIINNTKIVFTQTDSGVFADSLTIASVFNKVHKDMVKVMKRDEAFEEFITGGQISPSTYIDKSGKSNPLYLFDRDAFSYFVMGFTGKEAKRWKLDYIKAFNEMEKRLKANTLATPQTYIEALKALVISEEAKQKLALENKAQAKQIEQDKPKVEFAEAIETSSNAIMIGAYAKLLSKEHHVSVGPNLLFEFFRDDGILLKSKEKRNLPAARYMNNGYFEVEAETRNGKEILTPLITGKGQIALLDKITKHFGKQNHQPSLFG